MKQRNILTLILLLAALTLAAQNNYSPCYTNNIAKGDAAFKQGKYNEAKTYYATAKQCAGGNPTAAQQKINQCNAKLNPDSKSGKTSASSNSKQKAYQSFTVNGVTFKMIFVQGGTYTMGCTFEQGDDCESDESPAHSVTLSSFYMGETEVTIGLWKAVMGSLPPNVAYWGDDNYPITYMRWEDCQVFIQRLNQLTGKSFRLPTEAEWEYAARGGINTHYYKYAGSNSIGDVSWFYGNHERCEQIVKTKGANELGLYDMSGNMDEWCSDWYGSYSSSPQTDPQGPSTGTERVYRGGSWGSKPIYHRVTCRSHSGPTERYSSLGFRLAL
jgi:formylglycine-generating enzyme required for sulfatase activity